MWVNGIFFFCRTIFIKNNNMIHLITPLAKAYNTLDASLFNTIIANKFVYESQMVFAPMVGKANFLEYITGKFATIKNSGALVYAEIGYSSYNNDTSVDIEVLKQTGKPSIIMAQNNKEEKVALLMPEFNKAGLIIRMDMCGISPHWSTAKRTYLYPGLV
jgi:hypothetical protein